MLTLDIVQIFEIANRLEDKSRKHFAELIQGTNLRFIRLRLKACNRECVICKDLAEVFKFNNGHH